MEIQDRFQASLTDDGRYRLLVEAVTDYAIRVTEGGERLHRLSAR